MWITPVRHIELPLFPPLLFALCAIPPYFFHLRIFQIRFNLPALCRPPTLTLTTLHESTRYNYQRFPQYRSASTFEIVLQTLARKLDLRFLRHSQPPHELKLSPCAKSNILIFTQSRRGGCRSGSGGSSGPGNLSLQLSSHLGQWPECNTRAFLA